MKYQSTEQYDAIQYSTTKELPIIDLVQDAIADFVGANIEIMANIDQTIVIYNNYGDRLDVNPGDWIVKDSFCKKGRATSVFPDDQFRVQFKPIPERKRK